MKNGENGEIYCTMLAGTEPQPRGFSSGTQGTCITLLVPLRNVISERRRLQNKNGEKSGENGEKSGENGENGKSGEKSGENGENYSYDTIPTDPDNRIILFTSFILRLEIILWVFDSRRWRSERLKSER